MNRNQVYFAKVKDNAIIPTKRLEDAGYDMYPCFDEDYIEIKPHDCKMIPLGIASAFHYSKVLLFKERGSTGTKNIGQRSGVIDSGYRGEYMCPITNHNDDVTLVIIKKEFVDDYLNTHDNTKVLIYPYEKAITQAIFVDVPEMIQEELTYDELLNITSDRGCGKLGSSGK